MYNVKVFGYNYGEGQAEVEMEYTGCLQFRTSDSGMIAADFYDGSAKMYKLCEGDAVVKTPMTEEEILSTPGLGEWYQAQMDAAAEAAAKEAAVDAAVAAGDPVVTVH